MINGKFYIGSTKNLYKRSREHYSKLNTGKHPNIKLMNSINKYGIGNFKFEALDINCKIEDLLVLEGKFIQNLKPEYNIDEVDLGGNRICSDSTKKLIGEKSKQKFIDNPELKEKLALARNQKEPWSKGLTGVFSEETLKLMSVAGKKNIEKRAPEIQQKFYDARAIAQEKRKVKIIQYDLNMSPIKEYDSFTEAAKLLGAKSVGNFHTACHKGIKLFDSYWRIKE
jgi:group I intron endonuclease